MQLATTEKIENNTNTILRQFRSLAVQEQREADQMYSAMILSVQSLRLRLTRSVRLAISRKQNQEHDRS